MRMTDQRGVEYDVTFDAERGLYVYTKVVKPSPEPNLLGGEASHPSPHTPSQTGQSAQPA